MHRPDFNNSARIEPRDIDWHDFQAILAQIPVAKRNVTRMAETTIPGIVKRPFTAALLSQLQTALATLDERMEFLEHLLNRASILDDSPPPAVGGDKEEDDPVDSYFKAIQQYTVKVETARDIAAKFFADNQPANSSQQPAAPNHEESRNPDKLLSPDKLSACVSGIRLERWIDSFTVFLQSGRHLNTPRQHAYLDQFLEQDLKDALDGLYVHGVTPVLEAGGMMDIIRSQSLISYPIFNRRLDYFDLKRGEGENVLEYLHKIDNLCSVADIASMTPEDITLHRFMSSCNDTVLRDKIRNEKRQDMTYIKQFVRQYVQNLSAENAIKESVKVVAAVQPTTSPGNQRGRGGRNGRGGRGRRGSNRPRIPELQGCCYRCGKPMHRDPATECVVLVNGLSCDYCGIRGHLANICRKRLGGEAKTVSAVAEDFSEMVTPHLNVKVNHKHGELNVNSLLDTGSAATLISSDVAAANHIEVQPSNSCLQTLTGESIPTTGQAPITISTQSASIQTTAEVTPSTSEDLLIGYRDLQRLGIIPKNFPVQACKPIDFQRIRNSLIKLFPDVLTDILPDSAKTGPLMKIHLKRGEKVPFRVTTARAIPLHWVEKAERCVNKLLNAKSIAPQDAPTEWCAPGFFVLKPDGELRLVVDYTGLNSYVERPTHVFPSTSEIIAGIDPKSRYFAKLDALSGYHQVPLDEESAKLTTFLLPCGRFKHLVAPMGLSASSDEFCRRSDEVIANLPGVRKLVDDILISAPTIDILTSRIQALLQRCRERNFILSQKKFEIGSSVEFAGHVINAKGVFPQGNKLQGIQDFPPPTNLTQLRSFIGMCNQLQSFSPNLANLVSPLLPLLKAGEQFQWLPEHQTAFDSIKTKLAKNLALHHFDPSIPTSLITDASIAGLGFALIQTPTSGKPRIIQCGSRTLIPAEKNYATIELEALAIAWAIMKCSFFLKGIPHFSVITDHRPLLGVFSKPLSRIANPRLVRIRERILDFHFSMAWLKGKSNVLADALSRHPPPPSAATPHPKPINACILAPASSVKNLRQSSLSCPSYAAIVQALRDRRTLADIADTHPAKQLKGEWHSLSLSDEGLILLDATRIYVPIGSRKQVLEQLHTGHCGLQKTWETAKTMFFWPGLKNQIKQMIERCDACQRFRPSQPIEPLIHTTADFPMHKVSADLAQAGGKTYLIMVDRFSGYPFVAQLSNQSTSAIVTHMLHWFRTYGFPTSIRTDGGPQFRGPFKEFCRNSGIDHENTSPYHPQSNGHAEAAVKNIKHLLQKVQPKDFPLHFSSWKNTARGDQPSPNALFFGRHLRLELPVTLEFLKTPTTVSNHTPVPKATQGRTLRPLHDGERVRIQCPHSKRWTMKGIITSVSDNARTYTIQLDSGEQIRRNRIFLKKCYV